MTVIRPVYQQGYVVQGVNASLTGIDIACERLYLDVRANPHYIVLSQVDHDTLYQDAEKTWRSLVQVPDETKFIIPALKKLINQTTGFLMEVFISDRIPQGTVFFGTFTDMDKQPLFDTL